MTNLKNKKTLISQIILAIVLLILLFLVLFPFWLMLVKSFKSFMQEVESPLTLTFPLAWENYRVAWEQIGGSILNSFLSAEWKRSSRSFSARWGRTAFHAIASASKTFCTAVSSR